MAFRQASLACSFAVSVAAVVPPIVLEDTSAVLAPNTTTCVSKGHGGSFQHNGGTLKDDVMTFAEYNFDPEEDGCYLIEEYHPIASCSSHPLQSVPIKINFCKNLTTMGYINQAINGGTWNKLTTLPFYKGWPASIEITREDLSGRMTACDSSGCFWIADAFRLTYLAPDCRDPAVRELMQQDDHTTVAGGENGMVQLDSAVTSTVQTTATTTKTAKEQHQADEVLDWFEDHHASEAEKPRMVLEGFLTDATVEDESAVFVFQPPVDGCYLIEEKHPHAHGLASAPLLVNYCKGMSAVGTLDHTDGRHDRWNYVASLPFYAGNEGRIFLPKSVVFKDSIDGGKRSHAFRLTHVGAQCHAAEAATHQMTVRITADFAHVTDRLTAFGQELLQLIADAAGTLGERLYMTDLRAGSIVAQVTVRPAAAVHGFEEAVGKETSAGIARKIEQSVAAPELASKICDLVGPSLNDCAVSVVASSVAHPQVEVVKSPREETSLQEVAQEVNEASGNMMESTGIWIIIGGAVFAVLVCVGLLALCRYRKQKVTQQQEQCADNKPHLDAEKGSADDTNIEQAKVNAVCPEAQKDADKDGHSDDASTVTPVEQRDDGVAVPGDGDSGDGSQGSRTVAQV